MGTPVPSYSVKKIFVLRILCSKFNKSGKVHQCINVTLLVLVGSLRTVLATQDRTLKLGCIASLISETTSLDFPPM